MDDGKIATEPDIWAVCDDTNAFVAWVKFWSAQSEMVAFLNLVSLHGYRASSFASIAPP